MTIEEYAGKPFHKYSDAFLAWAKELYIAASGLGPRPAWPFDFDARIAVLEREQERRKPGRSGWCGAD